MAPRRTASAKEQQVWQRRLEEAVLDSDLCGSWGLFIARIARTLYEAIPPPRRLASIEWIEVEAEAKETVRRLRQVKADPKAGDLDLASIALHGIDIAYFLHGAPPPDKELGYPQPIRILTPPRGTPVLDLSTASDGRSLTGRGWVRRGPTGKLQVRLEWALLARWKQEILSRPEPVWPSRGQPAGPPAGANEKSQPPAAPATRRTRGQPRP